jgi:hypothetical protein
MEGAVPGSCSAEGESLQHHPPAKTKFFAAAAAAAAAAAQQQRRLLGGLLFFRRNSKLVGIEPLTATSCKNLPKRFLLHIGCVSLQTKPNKTAGGVCVTAQAFNFSKRQKSSRVRSVARLVVRNA